MAKKNNYTLTGLKDYKIENISFNMRRMGNPTGYLMVSLKKAGRGNYKKLSCQMIKPTIIKDEGKPLWLNFDLGEGIKLDIGQRYKINLVVKDKGR